MDEKAPESPQEQPPPFAEQLAEQLKDVELTPELVAKLEVVFDSIITPLASLRQTVEKMHSGSIAYMDRIVLLAGGTLTLTFTALATISGHLADAGKSAAHPRYIVAECWLL
ncbi:MAG TPA: hypothetical protein VMU92_02535 [Acidobacteriaceae bacterium]|nr:hypothetical protein [Acidobacteriaceae bacterium]